MASNSRLRFHSKSNHFCYISASFAFSNVRFWLTVFSSLLWEQSSSVCTVSSNRPTGQSESPLNPTCYRNSYTRSVLLNGGTKVGSQGLLGKAFNHLLHGGFNQNWYILACYFCFFHLFTGHNSSQSLSQTTCNINYLIMMLFSLFYNIFGRLCFHMGVLEDLSGYVGGTQMKTVENHCTRCSSTPRRAA